MQSVMIPDIYWDGEYWCIFHGRNLQAIQDLLACCDGSVPNIILDVDDIKDIKNKMDKFYRKYGWLKKIVVKSGEDLIGIWGSNMPD